MSDLFPKWTNRLPILLIIGSLLVAGGVIAGMTYYFTPKYTRVGYSPIQPAPFSHKVHVNQISMDCRYCHDTVDKSWYAELPSASTCMNCHEQILRDDPRLALVRESVTNNQPIPWVKVHTLPDYVYFNHAAHVNQGVSCLECHGDVNNMDEIRVVQPLSMSFCLDCHRNPNPRLRPLDKVTQLDWLPTNNVPIHKDWNLPMLESCSTCHR